jgi:short-subunit dehydrogenase involved in D-alanine esterification of teichoic acids
MTGDELLELEDRLDRCTQIVVDAECNTEFATLKKIQHEYPELTLLENNPGYYKEKDNNKKTESN